MCRREFVSTGKHKHHSHCSSLGCEWERMVLSRIKENNETRNVLNRKDRCYPAYIQLVKSSSTSGKLSNKILSNVPFRRQNLKGIEDGKTSTVRLMLVL